MSHDRAWLSALTPFAATQLLHPESNINTSTSSQAQLQCCHLTLFLPAINAGIAATLASVSMVGMVSNCRTKQD
jgi:hypothetical protein